MAREINPFQKNSLRSGPVILFGKEPIETEGKEVTVQVAGKIEPLVPDVPLSEIQEKTVIPGSQTEDEEAKRENLSASNVQSESNAPSTQKTMELSTESGEGLTKKTEPSKPLLNTTPPTTSED